MNSVTTYNTSTTDSAATQSLAAELSRHLKGGDVIELKGDIGAGKTTFTQGLVKGLGYKDEVTSPTFTLSRVYPVRNGLQLHHFDLYRLSGHDSVSEELVEAFNNPKVITVVEWAGQDDTKLPIDRLVVEILATDKPDSRSLTITAQSPKLQHIIQELTA